MNRRTALLPRLPAFVAIVALCASAYAQGAAKRDASAKPSGSRAVAQIPIELVGNEIFLQLRVNGSEPLWFGLDTGAGGSVINMTTAEALGLKMEGSHHAKGAGGQAPSSIVRRVSLDIGDAHLEDLTVQTIALASIENSMGHKMDGILGSEFFRRYVVELDYERQTVNVFEPASFDYKGRGESLPLSFALNHPYVRAKVSMPGREPIEGKFVLDTGSNFPLILLDSFVKENRLADSLTKTLQVTGRGVGGEISMPVGRTGRLTLGGYTLENPVTSFPQSGWFALEGAAGNIGGAVLRHFVVTFDYSRSRIFLEPNKNFSEPFEYDMSGIQFVTGGPFFKTVTVLRVLSDSPAAEAGLKQGDEIVSIGGHPVAELKLATLREMLRQPDKLITLQVKRGTETVNAEIKTRRLI